MRRALGIAPNRPTSWRSRSAATPPSRPGTDGVQVILTTEQRWPAYAWSFPLGDGRANVGYGELVSARVTRGRAAGRARAAAARRRAGRAEGAPAAAVDRPAAAARRPGAAGRRRRVADQPADRRGHLLRGAVRRAGRRGRGAAAATRARAYRRALQRRLGRHLRHSSTASWASRWPAAHGRRLPRRRGRPAGVRRRRRPRPGRRPAHRPHPAAAPAASADGRPAEEQLWSPPTARRRVSPTTTAHSTLGAAGRACSAISAVTPRRVRSTARVDPPRLSLPKASSDL